MSYTIPEYVDTREQAVLAVASAIKGEAVTGGDGSVNRALDVLADVLAEHDVSVPQTDAGAILALAQYASGMVKPEGTIAITENGEGIDVAQYATADVSVSGGGGGSQTTDVYLWNMKGNVVPSKVEYISGYSGGNPTYTELETEGITNEFNSNTVYGIKVKDCPAGGHLNYTLPAGYVFAAGGAPHIGYSAVLFPDMPGVSSTAMIPIDGMYQVASFAVMTYS